MHTYAHSHESLYNELTTIIPKHFFTFKDFPPKLDKLHYTHAEMLEYLKFLNKINNIEALKSFIKII